MGDVYLVPNLGSITIDSSYTFMDHILDISARTL
jgi:hypothetical protein